HLLYMDWHDYEEGERAITEALKIILESEPDEQQVATILYTAHSIIHFLTKDGKGKILEILSDLWINPREFYGLKDFNDPSPFANFKFIANQDSVRYWLTIMGADSYKYANKRIRRAILDYILKYGGENEKYSYHVTAVYFYGILLDETDNIEKQLHFSSLKSYMYNTRDSLETQTGIAHTLFSMMTEDFLLNGKIGFMQLKGLEIYIDFIEFIVSWLSEMHWKPLPDLRRNIALITNFLIIHGVENTSLEEIKTKLKKDARARVRCVFNKK
ncbi:MAG: hypothetical protein LWY06_10395, partial [Firmicutes bacterium]|nr:hypothetical protein [Bacillota bacterium]